MALSQSESYDYGGLLNAGLTLLFTFICLVIIIRAYIYIKQELKTSPVYTRGQKIRNQISAITFSFMLGFAGVFVLAMITSIFARNGLLLLPDIENTIWTEDMVKAFQFPNFLPITLFLIAGFAIFYPIYEYYLLSKPSQEGATEIQQGIENKFIDRFETPWNTFAAFFVFLLVVVVAPTITSFIAINYWDIPSNLTDGWVIGIIFFVWLLLGPMFYLSYYTYSGTAHTIFRGNRVVLKKEPQLLIFYIIAILSIIATIYSLIGFSIDYIPIFWDKVPESVANPSLSRSGLVEEALTYIYENTQYITTTQFERIQMFFTLFPLDFIGFIVTTSLFGMFGFYKKFLSKEPLNTSKMVLFAAYIIIGIAFSIFMNAMFKYPDFFPDDSLKYIGLDLDFSRQTDRDIIYRVFGFTQLIQRLLNIFFLVRFLGFDKSIRKNADEWVLNRAIIANDFETIRKYSTHEDVEMRKLVAESVLKYVKLKNSLSKQTAKYISRIIGEMLSDEDPGIVKMLKSEIDKIILKLDRKTLTDTLIDLLASDDKVRLKRARNVIRQIVKKSILDPISLFQELFAARISTEGYETVFQMVLLYEKSEHKAVWHFIQPFLSPKEKAPLILGALSVIEARPRNFSPEQPEIVALMSELLLTRDVPIVTATLKTFGTFAMTHPDIIPTVMGLFNGISDRDEEIVRQKLGVIVKSVGVKPEWFPNFFAYLEMYLKSDNIQHKSDAAVALGGIGAQISVEDFKKYLYPHCQLFVNHRSLDVRKGILSSLIVMAQSKQDLYSQDFFQHLFSPLLIDVDISLRHQVQRFFVESDHPYYLLGDIAILLKTPLDVQIRVDILNIINQIAEKIVPYLKESGLIEILKDQAEQNFETLGAQEILELKDKKTTFFGFRQEFQNISVYGTTMAVLAQLMYYSPSDYDELFLYLESHYQKGGEIALAKLFDVYLKIIAEKIQKTRGGYGEITFDQVIQKIQDNFHAFTPGIYEILLKRLNDIYPLDKKQYATVFEVMYNLLQLDVSITPVATKQTLVLLASLIGDHPKFGFSNQNILDYQAKSHRKVNPFEETFKRVIYREMPSEDPLIQEGVSTALKRLLVAAKHEKLVRGLILDTIKTSSDARTKISAMNVLMSLPVQEKNWKVIGFIERELSSHDPFIKAKALEVIGFFVQHVPAVTAHRAPEYKRLKKIIYQDFFKNYDPKSPPVVKKAVLLQVQQILIKQPEFNSGLRLVIRAAQDPNPVVATIAVESYFEYAAHYEIWKVKFQQDIRSFANSSLPQVHQILVPKLLEYYQQGTRLNIVIPTLLKLAASDDPEIRGTTHDAFMEIFEANPEDFMNYFDIIFRLISDRNPMVRRDGGKMILDVLIADPELFTTNNKIFYSFQRLAFDSDPEVRFMLAKNLGQLAEKYPDRANDVLNMCYNLIRFNDDEIIQILSPVLRNLWATQLNFRNDIVNKLSRFYKKSQNPDLFNLLAEFDSKKSAAIKKRVEKFKSKEERHKWLKEQKEEVKAKKKRLKAKKIKKYKELYGEKPPFDLEGFEVFGRVQHISEIILGLLFVIFIAVGIWSAYVVGADIHDVYAGLDLDQLEGMSRIVGKYFGTSLILIACIYVVSLLAAYFVVRVFAEIAMIMMYLVLFVQVALLFILYRYVDFEINGQNYNWIFLVLVIPSVLFLTIWYRKFKRASVFLKMSCLVVVKEKQMLIPQFFQTLWVNVLSLLYGFSAWKFFLKQDSPPTQVYTALSDLGISDQVMFIGYTALFVFLIYIVFYTSLGMKQLMIHHWYRGGSLSFGKSVKIIRRRWWGLMGYAFTSTIIHMIQVVTKVFKGDYKPKNAKEAMELAAKVRPVDPQSFDKTKRVKGKKKKAPLLERIWMFLNMFTMPAIVLEKRPYSLALARSVRMIVTNTVDLFIKKSNINVVFRVMQYTMWATNALIGGFVGALFGWIYGVNMIITVGISVPLFLWVGGFTQTLIINDLNTSYITIMYMHTLDIINKKYGYTRYKLEKPKEIEQWEKKQERQEEHRSKREERRARRKAKREAKKAAKQGKKADTQPTSG